MSRMNRAKNIAAVSVFAVVGCVVVGCAVVGCDQAGDDEFFDPGALEDGAADLGDDFTVVPCKGADDLQRWEWHPRLVRGQVLAPGGALVQRNANPLYDLLVPSAHAVPLEGESVVSDAPVSLMRGDVRHHQTTTDALGRFCLVVPEGSTLGPTWRIEAEGPGITLRRVALDTMEADVSVQTEAVYRAVTSARPPRETTEHEWRNISTMAATTLDLTNHLTLTPGMSASDAVDEATDRLQSDRRIRDAIQ